MLTTKPKVVLKIITINKPDKEVTGPKSTSVPEKKNMLAHILENFLGYMKRDKYMQKTIKCTCKITR